MSASPTIRHILIIFSKVDIIIIGLARCAEVRVENLYYCINIKASLFLL
jgi:hypothetical protein